MRKLLLAAALLIGAGAALAQVPALFIASPVGTEQISVTNAGPQTTTVLLRQLRDASGYSKQSPSTGFSLSFAAGQSEMQVGGGSTISAGTITLTASPVDGQLNCFYTKPIVTTLTMAVVAGQTLNDGVSTTSATTRYCYQYSASNTSWDRIQ